MVSAIRCVCGNNWLVFSARDFCVEGYWSDWDVFALLIYFEGSDGIKD